VISIKGHWKSGKVRHGKKKKSKVDLKRRVSQHRKREKIQQPRSLLAWEKKALTRDRRDQIPNAWKEAKITFNFAEIARCPQNPGGKEGGEKRRYHKRGKRDCGKS